ncbi:MAG: maltose alpha-D-glucosyltransferase [Thermoleophilia bacterium]
MNVKRRDTSRDVGLLENDPLWYKEAIIYELHVRAFADSNGDGIGDFRGLTQKLDYLQDLGVTTLWLLPFYPSPLRDDGYDIADYSDVHPDYGTLQDFRVFLRAAHRRGLRVITELVINHTSDQHEWFQRSRRAKPGSKWWNYYVWSDTPDKYRDARIIFKDFESSNWAWDPIAEHYYWHRFYSHQPDLNFDSPAVRRSIFQVLDFWLKMGIDGLRLDAVPYLYEREGTTSENLPETHAFLKRLRRHIDQNFSDRMLLAEANQWPEDAAEYFGKGDECHMAFHFPVMPRLFMGTRMEDRFPIIDILQQTPDIPDNCQWAIFLRNHDELTLEMVTDEDRDYMYRSYAADPRARINLGIRHRLAPLLNNDRRKIELMHGLLFSLPGTPVMYYGDEIGMGDNIYLGDRDGVRTPMQWSPDRNAGFSKANPQKLYLPVIIDPEYHYEAINVEAQNNNSQSLLWWIKRLIGLRKRYKAFGLGETKFLYPENRKVLAFVREYQDERILVVANLSRFTQYVELDLSEYAHMSPVELSGRTTFPEITEDTRYFLTLSPHAFYWFELEPTEEAGEEEPPRLLTVRGEWQNVFSERATDLERILGRHLRARRWFRGKARTIIETTLADTVPVEAGDSTTAVTFVKVEYATGEPETYILPLAFLTGDQADQAREEISHRILCRLRVRRKNEEPIEGVLYDAFGEPAFTSYLVEGMGKRRRFKGAAGALSGVPTRAFREMVGPELPAPTLLKAEQTNTSAAFGDRTILKLYRRVEAGINPDLELGRFLTTEAGFRNTPAVGGALEYRRRGEESMTVALLQEFVANEGDAWRYTLDSLERFYERALADRVEVPDSALTQRPLSELQDEELPPFLDEAIGHYLPSVEQLGVRTAEMHLALASARDDASLAPETFTLHYQRSLYQSVRTLARQAFEVLSDQLESVPDEDRGRAQELLELEDAVVTRLRRLLEGNLSGQRIRIHGDYHLGQVLYTGRDFVIIDFEGEPARPLTQRRMKRSALVDVAGMIRSFHYAAHYALRTGGVRPEDVRELLPWARFWYEWVSRVFLLAYTTQAGKVRWLPRTEAEFELLLDFLVLEKALYELRYELNNRPDWVGVPLLGILEALEESIRAPS